MNDNGRTFSFKVWTTVHFYDENTDGNERDLATDGPFIPYHLALSEPPTETEIMRIFTRRYAETLEQVICSIVVVHPEEETMM